MRFTAARCFALCFSLLMVISGVGVSLVHAEFDPEGPGYLPLDNHSENRLKRYVESENCPVTTDEAFLTRCRYLIEKKRNEAHERYTRRTQTLNRKATDRFLITTFGANDSKKSAEPFDPYGPGSDMLDENTEIRIQRYVRNDNCEINTLTELERTRCSFLLNQRDQVRVDAIDRRRINVQNYDGSSLVRELTSRRAVRGGYVRVEVIPENEPDQAVSADLQFDFSGTGSVMLSASDEKNIRSFAINNSCSRLTSDEKRVRCEYLVKLENFQRQKALVRTSTRIQSQGVIRGDTIRRTVRPFQKINIDIVQSTLKVQVEHGGFKPRPRTLQEVQDNFTIPVILRSGKGDSTACVQRKSACQ